MRSQRRGRHDEPWTHRAPSPRVRVERDDASALSGALVRGLDPALLGIAERSSALGQLGSVAGNGAVRELVSLARSDREMAAPKGAEEMAKQFGPSKRGHTRLELKGMPPLFRANATGSDGKFSAKPSPVSVREPDFTVHYLGPGRHRLPPGYTQGSSQDRWLEVSGDWSKLLAKGEDDHVRDQTLAIDWTWGRVTEAINRLAKEPPATGATAEAAEQAAWARFKEALPAVLRPAGARPTEEAQLARWDDQVKGSPFEILLHRSQRARDHSGWHTPGETFRFEGDTEIVELTEGKSQIGKPTPEELMKAAWDELKPAP